MRRFLIFLLFLTFLFLVASLFLPSQLYLKRYFTVANNSSIVYQELQGTKALSDWLINARKKKTEQIKGTVYWEEDGTSYSCKILARKPTTEIVFLVRNVQEDTDFTGLINIDKQTDKSTNVSLEVRSAATINPFLRYTYWLDKDKIEKLINDAFSYFSKSIAHIAYERFYLSEPKAIDLDRLAFVIPRQTTVSTLAMSKKQPIDSLLRARLLRYHILDTTSNTYIQYTNWTDSIVNYQICLPLLKSPTLRQSAWLKGGEITNVKGRFYMAKYKGSPADLGLAWDSLYHKASEAHKLPKGFPLEQLIEKNDSIESRLLFIKLP